MVENVDRMLREADPDEARSQVVTRACTEVARPIAFAIAIIVIVFLPLFLPLLSLVYEATIFDLWSKKIPFLDSLWDDHWVDDLVVVLLFS